jgi:hypothetical protein
MLAKLLAEEGTRIICGDTTAEIAARLLGARLAVEPRPEDGWWEVPPTSRLIKFGEASRVDLVTEGAVTLGVVRQRIASARRLQELAGRADGASRLARRLLDADKITFLVGLAVNPAQTTADGAPMRWGAVEAVVRELRARGKIVTVEHV